MKGTERMRTTKFHAAGVRAARGGAAAARVVGLGAEAPRGRGGLAPRLTIPLPPYPLNYGHNK